MKYYILGCLAEGMDLSIVGLEDNEVKIAKRIAEATHNEVDCNYGGALIMYDTPFDTYKDAASAIEEYGTCVTRPKWKESIANDFDKYRNKNYEWNGVDFEDVGDR